MQSRAANWRDEGSWAMLKMVVNVVFSFIVFANFAIEQSNRERFNNRPKPKLPNKIVSESQDYDQHRVKVTQNTCK